MSAFHWSITVWGTLLGIVLVAEILAWQDWVPWNTLSWTLWQLQAIWSAVAIIVAAVMAILSLHFLFRWPSRKRWQPPQGPEGRS